MYSDVTGIILAGGKSTRMGANKSLLKIGNITLVEHVLQLMQSIFEKVVIITNTPDEFRFLNVALYKDIYEYYGPLAGIHSGLHYSVTNQNFIISVDMPLMTEQMIKYIVDFPTPLPITVCRADGFVQQLAGRYSKDVISIAENALSENEDEIRHNRQSKRKCKVLSLLDEAGAEILDAQKLDFYEDGLFYNMNRPDDYKFILDRIEIN